MMIRRFVLAVLLLCRVLCLAAQSVDEAWVKSHYEKQEYYIPMRDGVHLFTAVYKPRESKGGNPFLVLPMAWRIIIAAYGTPIGANICERGIFWFSKMYGVNI